MYSEQTVAIIKNRVDELFNQYIEDLRTKGKEEIIDSSEKTVFYLELSNGIKSFVDVASVKLSDTPANVARLPKVMETTYYRIYVLVVEGFNLLDIGYDLYTGMNISLAGIIDDELESFIGNLSIIKGKIREKERVEKINRIHSFVNKDYIKYTKQMLDLEKEEIMAESEAITYARLMYKALNRNNHPFDSMDDKVIDHVAKVAEDKTYNLLFVVSFAEFFVNEYGSDMISATAFPATLEQCMTNFFGIK